MALNERQRRFAREYPIDTSATAAAKRAGYSEKTAYSQGQRLLKHVEVQEAIAQAQAHLADRTTVSAEKVIREFSRIAFSDPLSVVTVNGSLAIKASDEWTEDEARAVREISEKVDSKGQRQISVKFHDKVRALENLAKHLGLLVERLEVHHTHEDALDALDPEKDDD